MVYVLIADGFEEAEALLPVDILRRSGIEVKTVGVKSKIQVGAHSIPIICDIEINEINVSDIEMIILPGGSGYKNLDSSEKVHNLIDYCVENNIYIAAICAAPSILGKKNLLKDKKAVCYPGFSDFLYGAEISEDKTATDGIFITGKGPGAAAEFGFEIVSILKDKETSDKVKELMLY